MRLCEEAFRSVGCQHALSDTCGSIHPSTFSLYFQPMFKNPVLLTVKIVVNSKTHFVYANARSYLKLVFQSIRDPYILGIILLTNALCSIYTYLCHSVGFIAMTMTRHRTPPDFSLISFRSFLVLVIP